MLVSKEARVFHIDITHHVSSPKSFIVPSFVLNDQFLWRALHNFDLIQWNTLIVFTLNVDFGLLEPKITGPNFLLHKILLLLET